MKNNGADLNIHEGDEDTGIQADALQRMFAPLKNKDSDQQDIFFLIKKVIHHMHTLVQKDRVDNEYIKKNIGNLSARELLQAGKTFYMNPCLDFVLITIEGLKRAGIQDITFVIDELKCNDSRYKLHFGIELLHENQLYYIDYRQQNNVFIGKGVFESKYEDKGEKIVNSIKIKGNDITIDDNIYALIDRGLVDFKFFDIQIFDLLKEKLARDNTDEQRYAGFVSKVKNINEPEIVIEDNTSKISVEEIKNTTMDNLLSLSYEQLLQPTEKREPKRTNTIKNGSKKEITNVIGDFKLFMDDFYGL